MPTTEVTSPSGNIIYVDHLEGATDDDIFNAARNFDRTTDDRGTLLGNAAKTFLSGGIEAAINVGAGGAQITAMGIDILDGEMDGINPNMGESVQIMSDVAQRWRKLSMGIDERMGIDPEFANSLGGEVLNGLGQMPVNIAASIAGGVAGAAIGTVVGGPAGGVAGGTIGGLVGGGLVIAPQMTTEAIMDAERTLNKKYIEFSNEEMDDAALSALGYTALGGALEYVGLIKSVPQLKRFLRGQLRLPSGAIKEITKSLRREILEAFGAEGFSESAQGQLLDSFAAATYDDDRELMSFDVLANRFNEFLVGGIVGGTAAGATGLFTKREQDVQNQFTKPTGANSFDVVVVDDASGREFIIPIEAAANEEEAIKIAQEGLDAYETKSPDLTFTVTGATPSQGRVEQVIEEPEAQAEPEETPAFIDYSNTKAGDTIEIIGVNGKRTEVEVIGVSKAGSIRFRRKDGTEDIVGLVPDSVPYNIYSPDYVLQAAGHGTRNKNIKDLSDSELDALEASIDEAMQREPALRQAAQTASLDHISDKNAIKLERGRRQAQPQAQPEPTPEPIPDETETVLAGYSDEQGQPIDVRNLSDEELSSIEERAKESARRKGGIGTDTQNQLRTPSGQTLINDISVILNEVRRRGRRAVFPKDVYEAAFGQEAPTPTPEPTPAPKRTKEELEVDIKNIQDEIIEVLDDPELDYFKDGGVPQDEALKPLYEKLNKVKNELRATLPDVELPVLYRGVEGDFDPLEIRIGLDGKPYGLFFSSRKETANSYIRDPSKSAEAFELSGVKESDIIDVPVKDGRFSKVDFDRLVRENPSKLIRAKNVIDIGPRASKERDPERLYSYESDIYGTQNNKFFSKQGEPTPAPKTPEATPQPETPAQPEVQPETAPEATEFKIETDINPKYTKGGFYRKILGYKVRAKDGKDYYIQAANQEQEAGIRFAVHEGSDAVSNNYIIGFPTKKEAVEFLQSKKAEAPATPTAQPVPATSVPAPTTAQPQRTGTFQLPKGLRGAKSRYKDATVNFASDFEKAVYIVGKVKGKKSARFNDYLAELENAGYTPKEIQELRKEMMSDLNYKYQRGDRDIDTVRLTQKDIVAGASTPKVKIPYNLLNSPFINQYNQGNPEDTSVPDFDSLHYVISKSKGVQIQAAIESGAVDNLANQVAEEAREMLNNEEISAGLGWYGRMRKRLEEIFGADSVIFTHLLGTTSAQTAVEQNFKYSVDLYNRFKAGEFDKKIKKYLELKGRLQSGTLGNLLIRIKAKNSKGVTYTKELVNKTKPGALLQQAARHYDLLPKQKGGKLYGSNSYPALKALSEVWFEARTSPNKMTPKTPQFAMNLNGESLEATIDIWAARLLRRIIYKDETGSRILPAEEQAVSNADFALGQIVFRRAAEKLGIAPDDLQALVWFGEKEIWDKNGWTGAAGALKSSFDESANVFYPVDGTKRSEQDANKIIKFLATERLVLRDINFPDSVSDNTKKNNRKKYDKQIRTSVISDYLESEGRRPIYESESVESGRERQDTDSGTGQTQEEIVAGGFLGDFFDAGLNTPVDNSTRTPQEQRIEPTDNVNPEGYANERELEQAIEDEFGPIAKALGLARIIINTRMGLAASYNVTRNTIQFNPSLLIGQSKEYVRAAMREEIIHAVTHEVIKKQGGSWLQFFGQVGRDMNPKERRAVSDVYPNLKQDYEFGAEFYRMIIQQGSYGQITEQFSRNSPAMSKIQKLLKKVQSYMARLLKTIAGEKYQADVMIAQSAALLAQVDPSARPTNQKVIEDATESIAIQTGQREITAGVAAEINTPPSKKKKNKEKLGFMDKYVNTVSRVLSKINPRIAQAFQGYFNTIEAEKNDAIKRVLPFVQKYNAIKSKADKDRLKQLLMYSPLKQDEQPKAELIAERDALLRKYDMYNDLIFGVQPVLSRLRSNAREQGIDVGFLESFFPRRVIDYKGLKDSLGETIADDINLALEQRNAEIETENIAIMERNSKLQPGQKGENLIPKIEKNSPEEALFIEDYIRKAGTSEQFLKNRGISIKIPREELSRRFELIQKEQLEFYDDVPSALESYITNMIVATRTTELMGRRYEELDVTLDPTFEKVRTPGTLSPIISELLESGEINAEDVKTVRNIARMILNPAAKENPLLSGMRQASYISTLVEFTSTLSQLFDMPFVMYRNGLINTVRGLGMTRDFSLESFGYAKDRVSDEFTDEKSFLNSAAKFGLKAVGFTKLDQIMKESNLAASYLQLRKLARGYYKNRDSKASKKFRLEIEQYNGAENVDATIAALKKGDRDNALVRNFVFAQLLKTQPMSKMQSVAAQSANPNVRFVYQMKSFMIAQLAYTRQEIFDDLFGSNSTTKQRAVALSNLTKLMGFMLLVGLPVDALKDFLAGRLGYLDDYLLNGMVRSFGISKYQFYQIKREGLGQAALDFITPITVQQGVDYTAELQRVMSGDKALTESKLVSIAPASDVINRLFGFTREKEMKEYRRRLKEGDVPFIRPPGSL